MEEGNNEVQNEVLVLGYYYRSNLGDEMFREELPGFFPSFKCVFRSLESFDGKIGNAKAIIIGGGDLINDYFAPKLDLARQTGLPVLGFNIGVSYFSTIGRGYFDFFDALFIRQKKPIARLQKRLGSTAVFYNPDIGFNIVPKNRCLPLQLCGSSRHGSYTCSICAPKAPETPKSKNIVGVFLVGSMLQDEETFFNTARLLEALLPKYNICLYRFDSDGRNGDEKKYNEILVETLSKYGQISADSRVYTPHEMVEIASTLDFGICVRFHSCVFAIDANLPFIAIGATKKVRSLCRESNYEKYLVLPKSKNSSVFSWQEALEKFNSLVVNVNEAREILSTVWEKNLILLDTKQPNAILSRLIQTRSRRPQLFDWIESISVDKITDHVLQTMKKYQAQHSQAALLAQLLTLDVTGMPSNKYTYGTQQNIAALPPLNSENESKIRQSLRDMVVFVAKDFVKDYLANGPRLNLHYINQNSFRSFHRAGWSFVVDYLGALNTPNGVLCDTYMDATFHWAKPACIERGILPYTSHWIGFLHHTNHSEFTTYDAESLFNDLDFIRSTSLCRGIVCLSQYLASWVRKKFQQLNLSIPVLALYHPTAFPAEEYFFSFEKFKEKRSIVNIGAWYRNPFSITTLKTSYQKFSLRGNGMENYFAPVPLKFSGADLFLEQTNIWCHYFFKYVREHYNIDENTVFDCTSKTVTPSTPENIAICEELATLCSSVTILPTLDNLEYDKLLQRSVVYLDLVDASAVNTVIECIVRNTPILVNRLPALEEYLGVDYPLFFDVPNPDKYLNDTMIEKATRYLQAQDKERFRIERFLSDLTNSEIYRSCNSVKYDL